MDVKRAGLDSGLCLNPQLFVRTPSPAPLTPGSVTAFVFVETVQVSVCLPSFSDIINNEINSLLPGIKMSHNQSGITH